MTFLRDHVRPIRAISLLKKPADGEHLQIFLEQIKAKIPQVHDPRLASAILRDLKDVCRYLNPTAVTPLASANRFHATPSMCLATGRVNWPNRKLWTSFLEKEYSPVYAFTTFERWWNWTRRSSRITNLGGGARGSIMNRIPDVLANPYRTRKEIVIATISGLSDVCPVSSPIECQRPSEAELQTISTGPINLEGHWDSVFTACISDDAAHRYEWICSTMRAQFKSLNLKRCWAEIREGHPSFFYKMTAKGL